jgi:predicted nuclease of predicted toxin-antitoxin system
VRLLADTNVTTIAVRALRDAGHDVVYVGERQNDPGDIAILREAAETARVLLTKDHDIGALVFRDGAAHSGVVLSDDLGSGAAEAKLLLSIIDTWAEALAQGGFVRAGYWGSKAVS